MAALAPCCGAQLRGREWGSGPVQPWPGLVSSAGAVGPCMAGTARRLGGEGRGPVPCSPFEGKAAVAWE